MRNMFIVSVMKELPLIEGLRVSDLVLFLILS